VRGQNPPPLLQPAAVPATPRYAFNIQPAATPLAHHQIQQIADAQNNAMSEPAIPGPSHLATQHPLSTLQKHYLLIDEWLDSIAHSGRLSQHDQTDYPGLVPNLIGSRVYTTQELICLGMHEIARIAEIALGDAARLIEWAEEDRNV
jgi:hypothetical protein